MHGKIVRYLNSNGKGVVINASKMLFDFTKEAWHDKKVMPMVGMFVEFRCNELHQITDCKVSRFQEFGGNTMLSEADFWRHDTDEELITLQSNARDAIVQKIYKSTDYMKLTNIPLDIKIIDAMKDYFHQEFLAIAFLNDLPFFDNGVSFDYTHLKRFSVKALDNLLFNDKTIAKDDFIEELGVITRLESSFQDFEKYTNVNLKQMFLDAFLKKQCHYQALVVAVNNAQDSKNLAEKRIHSLTSDIALFERRIGANLDVDKNTQKLERAQKELEQMQKENAYYSALFTSLSQIKTKFEVGYFKTFSEMYHKIYMRIYQKVKSGLDICMTILDNKIYQKSVQSVAFSKSFFKIPENDRVPNMLYFAERYLGHLNKERLNEKDALLYQYIKKISAEYRKNFLIISTNEKRATEFKIKILSQNKFNVVKTANKNTIYFALVNEMSFISIYIDADFVWKSPNELIRETKALKINANAKFAILPSAVKENRFGFAE